jgi:hypothetical protein
VKNRVKMGGLEASVDVGRHHVVATVKDHDPAYVASRDGHAKLRDQVLRLLAEKLDESAHVRWRVIQYDVDVPTDLSLPCGIEWLGNRDDTYQCDSPEGHDGPHTFTIDGGTLRWSGGSDA